MKVVGGALRRYASDPPRVPETFGSNFDPVAVFVFAGGWTHDNNRNAKTASSDARLRGVKIDIDKISEAKFCAGSARGKKHQ